MRAGRLHGALLGSVEQFGLHDQDTMLAYAGPDRAVLDRGWNAMPVLEDVREPNLIHWASFGKPWDDELTVLQDVWQEVAQRVEERGGAGVQTPSV